MSTLKAHEIKTIEENPLIVTEQDKHNYKLLLELFESSRFPGKILQPVRKEKWRKEAFQKFSKFDNDDLRKWIYEKTPLLNDSSFSYTIGTRLYWIYHGLTEFPKCQNEHCGKIMYKHKNIGPRSRYRNFCSIKCVNNASITRTKINATKEIKYGDPKYNNREQSKKTTKEHYGADNIFKTKEFIDKNKIKLESRIYRGTYGRYLFDGKKFDSSYEIAYYIWLKDNNIKFEYHPKIHFEYIVDGIKHRYYPDFKVGDKIIEIKSQRSFDENGILQPIYFKHKNRYKKSVIADKIKYAAKHKCMLDNNVFILTENELQQIFEYINNRYGQNYLFSFCIKK